MSSIRFELAPGLVLDARRAAWLPESRTLAVADLHLGYAWAHRARGQLMPLAPGEDTLARLGELIGDYEPREVVLLGDIVHEAVAGSELASILRCLAGLAPGRIAAVAGNHDRALARRLEEAGVALDLHEALARPGFRFEHGDARDPAAAREVLAGLDGWLLIGHEHPVVSISDGVARRVRVPCFLVGRGLLVLPAFSPWAAGQDIRRGEFLSAYLDAAAPEKAVAILAGRLLAVPMRRLSS